MTAPVIPDPRFTRPMESHPFLDTLKERAAIFDGGMGT